MCSYCSHILHGVTIPHATLECQYRRSMYCPVCAAYGHSPRLCPNKIAWAIRKGKKTDDLVNHVFSIQDTDESIKEFLKKNGASSGILNSGRIKQIDKLSKLELKKLLNDFANTIHPPRMILFTC